MTSIHELSKQNTADMLMRQRKKMDGTIKCSVSSLWATAARCPIMCLKKKAVLTGSCDCMWSPPGSKGGCTRPQRRPPKLCYFTVTVWVCSAAAAQLAVEVKGNKCKLARMKSFSLKVGYRGVKPQEESRCALVVFLFCIEERRSWDLTRFWLARIKSNKSN